MNDDEMDLEDTISDEDLEDDVEEFIRERIPTKITTGRKIRQIVLWSLYIMAFYFFAARNSGYIYFLELTGSDQITRLQFLVGFLVIAVFGNIAGPISGGIGAFLGDLTFQLASIKTIRAEYLIIATLI